MVFDEWYQRGLNEGLNFDLEVSIRLARAALQEWTRERVPLEWATTQNNLGNALSALGECESGQENQIRRLEEAVAAYRAALEERTRERVPLYWAMTQHNLGTALSMLGERESGQENQIRRLEEAVAACRAALQEYTQARVPLDWADAQNNLGNALLRLGERESGQENQIRRLEEAVAAYRATLQEWTRELAPLQWAMNMGNQCVAMRLLAGRTGDLAIAKQALSQIEAAFDTFRQADHAQYASYFESELPEAKALVDRLG